MAEMAQQSATPTWEQTQAPDVPSWEQTADVEDVYGGLGGMAKAFAAGAGRGASFGLSDQALVHSGMVSPETLKGLEQTNPIASAAGEIVGIIGPALVGDEAGLANLPGTVGRIGARVAETAEAKGAGNIVSKMAGRAAEGAVYGAGQSVSENALGDHDLISEKTLANIGLSAAFLGGVPTLVGQAAKMTGKALSSEYTSKALEYLSYAEKLKNPIKILTGTGVADTISGAISTGKKVIKTLGPEGRAQLKTIINFGDESNEFDKKVVTKIKDFLSDNKDSAAAKAVSKLASGDEFDEEEKNIIDNVMNAPHLEQKFSENLSGLDQHAPEISNSMKMGFIRGMQFLNSKLPQRPMDSFGNRAEISSADIQKFNRYRQAVESPLSSLDQLKDNLLAPETTEALTAVYPKAFNEMRQELINQLANRKNDNALSFQKKMVISQFLGEPMAGSLSPNSILNNQMIYANAPKPGQQTAMAQKPQRTRASGLNKMERADRAGNDYSAMDENV